MHALCVLLFLWVWALSHASHVPLYDVSSVSSSSQTPSPLSVSPPPTFNGSIAHTSSPPAHSVPLFLVSRSTLNSRLWGDRNSRCAAEFRCSSVSVCGMMWACLNASCWRRAELCTSEELDSEDVCSLQADGMQMFLTSMGGSCLDHQKREGAAAAAAPDSDPVSGFFLRRWDLGSWVWQEGGHLWGDAASRCLWKDEMLWKHPLLPCRVPAPPCPWLSAGARTTRRPTTWTGASWTTAASWMRSTWSHMSSSSSSPFLSSSLVSGTGRRHPQHLHTSAHTHDLSAQVRSIDSASLLVYLHLYAKSVFSVL